MGFKWNLYDYTFFGKNRLVYDPSNCRRRGNRVDLWHVGQQNHAEWVWCLSSCWRGCDGSSSWKIWFLSNLSDKTSVLFRQKYLTLSDWYKQCPLVLSLCLILVFFSMSNFQTINLKGKHDLKNHIFEVTTASLECATINVVPMWSAYQIMLEVKLV